MGEDARSIVDGVSVVYSLRQWHPKEEIKAKFGIGISKNKTQTNKILCRILCLSKKSNLLEPNIQLYGSLFAFLPFFFFNCILSLSFSFPTRLHQQLLHRSFYKRLRHCASSTHREFGMNVTVWSMTERKMCAQGHNEKQHGECVTSTVWYILSFSDLKQTALARSYALQ